MQVSDRNKNTRTIIVLAIITFVLQVSFSPQVSFSGGVINFALIFSACVALKYGGKTGTISGFIAGLVYDLTSANPIGLMALLLVVSTYILGQEVRDRLSGNFGSSLGMLSLETVIVTFLYHLVSVLMGTDNNFFEGLFFKAAPTILVTVVAAIPFVYVLSRSSKSHSSMSGVSLHGSHRAPHRFK